MKAIQITVPGKYQIVDTDLPAVGENDILIKVETVATCPRWDINMFTGHDMFDLEKSPNYPLPPGFPGHEAAGYVYAIGSKVRGFEVGDRVVALEHLPLPANGAYAEYMCYRPTDLMKLPDCITFEQATSFELLKCVVIGLQQFNDFRGKSVLVSGLGPAGLLAIQAVTRWGVSSVLGVDISEKRIEYARSLGICDVMDARKLGDLRFDLGYDCVGFSSSVQNVLDHVTEHLVVFGVSHGDIVYRDKWWNTGLRFETYQYRPFNQRDCELMIDLVANKGLNMECLFTHQIPFANYSDVVSALAGQDAIKVLFYPERDFGQVEGVGLKTS